jgi:hypothetical protein
MTVTPDTVPASNINPIWQCAAEKRNGYEHRCDAILSPNKLPPQPITSVAGPTIHWARTGTARSEFQLLENAEKVEPPVR